MLLNSPTESSVDIKKLLFCYVDDVMCPSFADLTLESPPVNKEVAATTQLSNTFSMDTEIVSRLREYFQQKSLDVDIEGIDWENLPAALDPARGGSIY